MSRITALLSVLMFMFVSLALAAGTRVHVRGAIVQLDGYVLTVKSREGSTVQVQLADDYGVLAVTTAELAAIGPGTYVGTAAAQQPDGTFRALEVLIFPESARGAGEGHYPWDLTPESTMTNAAVAEVVTHVDGRMLTLKPTKGAVPEVKVVVPPNVPIVTFGPGDKSLVQPGAYVFIGATKQPDGTLTAARILVGKDGLVPPM